MEPASPPSSYEPLVTLLLDLADLQLQPPVSSETVHEPLLSSLVQLLLFFVYRRPGGAPAFVDTAFSQLTLSRFVSTAIRGVTTDTLRVNLLEDTNRRHRYQQILTRWELRRRSM